MHYHLEIIMPPTDDVEAAVEQIMKPFDENGDDSYRPFWDFYSIGGRWAGAKAQVELDTEKLAAFRQWLVDEKVMVKGLVCGKEELADEATIAKVDAKWREMFPGAGERCTLFRHSNDPYHNDYLPGDVMRLDALPASISCERCIIATRQHDGKIEAESMQQESFYNGVQHIKTTWNGTVAEALSAHAERVGNYAEVARARHTPQPDWLVVTVDYHS